jgi:hypothetical protein
MAMNTIQFVGRPTVLLYAGAPRNAAAENVVTISFGTAAPEGVLVPVFTGPEPAERFLASLREQGNGMAIFELEGFDALERLLAPNEKTGVFGEQ